MSSVSILGRYGRFEVRVEMDVFSDGINGGQQGKDLTADVVTVEEESGRKDRVTVSLHDYLTR